MMGRPAPTAALRWCALLVIVAGIDPDAGIVINWAELDKIVDGFAAVDQTEWLPPVRTNCSGVLNRDLAHEIYRPLFCPWFVKPFRDVRDLAITETAKWPVYKKLMGARNVSVGLPVAGFFGVCVCGVYENATRALAALSAYDPCWYSASELERCNGEGRAVPRERTALTPAQYAALLRNASYADAATPHL